MHRPFRAPFSPLVPLLGIAFCGYLMVSLPLVTWLRFFIWMAVGMVIFFAYSRRRSLLAQQA
jgi:APA family basic amino acid/polyamine antiporter